jgi:hypothetical protein
MLLRRSSGLNGLGLFHTSRVVPERPLALRRGRSWRSDFVIPRACNLRRQRFERFFFSTLFVFIFGLDATFN